MEKQVDWAHYDLNSYYTKRRWCSLWYQVTEVMQFAPESVLEIGGGVGLFRSALDCFGVSVRVADIAEDLNPDILASVTELPLSDDEFDVVCAFQVLEHLPLSQFSTALAELRRVARKAVVFSVPDAKQIYCSQIRFPMFGVKNLCFRRPFFKPPPLAVGGEHQWELNRSGVKIGTLTDKLNQLGMSVHKHFRVPENPYHHFFVIRLEAGSPQ